MKVTSGCTTQKHYHSELRTIRLITIETRCYEIEVKCKYVKKFLNYFGQQIAAIFARSTEKLRRCYQVWFATVVKYLLRCS